MRRILLLLVGFLLCVVGHADNLIGRYKVRHITASEGLPGNTVRDIQQDGEGFLWMAGTGGLARYDGYRFVSFNRFGLSRGTGIPRHIGRLYMSPEKERLWLSTATYNNACFDLKQGRFVDYTGRGDDEHPYRKLVQTTNGVWLVSNTDGLRHVYEQDGKYVSDDYTTQNHRLPSDCVRNIDEDKDGVVWVATDNGLVRIDRGGISKTVVPDLPFMGCYANGDLVMAYNKTHQTAYVFNLNGRLLRKVPLGSVGHIGAMRGSVIWRGNWILFSEKETYVLDKGTLKWSKPLDCQIPGGSSCGKIGDLQFVANKSGNLWIFPERGPITRLNLLPAPMVSRDRNSVFSVTRGNDGLYYIGSYGYGLFVYDHHTGAIDHYTSEDRYPLIFSNYILYVTTDKSGCIWVSAENGGVSCLTPAGNMTEYFLIDEHRQGNWTNFISHLWKGKDGAIVVESKKNQLYTFSASGFNFRETLDYEETGHVVDRQGCSWTVRRGSGILVDGKLVELYSNGKAVETLDFMTVATDKFGQVWIGTWGQGLFLVKEVVGKRVNSIQVITSQFNESRIYDIAADRAGNLYVATLNGLVAINAPTPSGFRSQKLYNVALGNFPSDEIICVCQASDGIVWVGTTGGGLIRCDFSKGIDNMTYKQFTTRNGLSNNNIKSLLLDGRGYLWVGTEDGLSQVDIKDNYISRFDLTNNVLSNMFSRDCAIKLPDGRLAFGTANGLAIINPWVQSQQKQNEQMMPVISDLRINGMSIYEGLDTVVMDRSLVLSEKIKLSYNQNSLTFYFSSCDYRKMPSQLYQYYLDGIDRDWRQVTGESHAEYSNLSPGDYVFHLRQVSPHGPGEETVLRIHIGQPWYNTVWAWIVYLILICSVAYVLWRNAEERFRMNQQVKLEKQVAHFRTDFFTHITHEFRTPLAIMQNAVDRISRNETPSRKDIQTAQRGIRRLLRLVNQFLEYRRIETGKMSLQVSKGDVVAFVQDLYQDFRIMAERRNLTFTFTPFTLHYEVQFDHNIVESIIYNLLSNAVKYTSERGMINFFVRRDLEAGVLQFVVEDNGNGITGKQRESIFHPFMEGHVSKGGMGIGLSTSFRMAQLHHGTLEYSDVMPHGARFTFSMPDESGAYSAEECSTTISIPKKNDEDAHYQEIIREMAPKALNSQRVVVIEDDHDMQEQIVGEVGTYFQISAYGTGQEALCGVENDEPSLILCDIMLPDMDGYQVVTKLKGNEKLRNVPIIMLTALDDEAHQIKGYQVGADDYMIKPCNYHLLVARMMQLIKWHEGNVSAQKVETASVVLVESADGKKPVLQSQHEPLLLTSQADKRFCDQLEALVNKHVGDQDLSVDRLAEMMSMGRTKFYGRVKELFGMSPNKYIMNQRMEYAARLLSESSNNVSEVSYKVGFSDPTYFNKCFKAHFGIAPSKYKKL